MKILSRDPMITWTLSRGDFTINGEHDFGFIVLHHPHGSQTFKVQVGIPQPYNCIMFSSCRKSVAPPEGELTARQARLLLAAEFASQGGIK